MKHRIASTALAALIASTSLGMGAASAQPFSGRDARNERRDDRRDDRRDNRRDDRQDQRQQARWNQREHNGYYANGRFYYGQPGATQMRARDYRPAWQQWRRGDRLPAYGRSQYREIDWRRAHYREPPRGYHYVRDDRGEVLLVGIATGVILSILLNQ